MLDFRTFAKVAVFGATACIAAPSSAHEFWIEPSSYQLDVGEKIEARLKNGENFKGSTYPYLDELFSRFAIIDRNGARPVSGRRGDNPAVNETAARGGLHVIAYESTMFTVNYKKFEKFENFVRDKSLDWVLEAHRERKLPEDAVLESYYRYPKALIKVGSGAGRDKAFGMPFELVAEINPYTEAANDGVRVRLLYEGKAFTDAEIQIFHFPQGAEEAVKATVTTDKTGRATIPPFDRGPFLINAVHILEPRAEGVAKGAVWESLWAAMTYELPR